MNYRKIALMTVFLIAILGSVLFFPVKMESGRTCLFHKIIGVNTEIHFDQIPHAERMHFMLNEYLIPFALFWWISLAVLVWSLYKFKSIKLDKRN